MHWSLNYTHGSLIFRFPIRKPVLPYHSHHSFPPLVFSTQFAKRVFYEASHYARLSYFRHFIHCRSERSTLQVRTLSPTASSHTHTHKIHILHLHCRWLMSHIMGKVIKIWKKKKTFLAIEIVGNYQSNFRISLIQTLFYCANTSWNILKCSNTRKNTKRA